jgi:hypothetical protein
MKPTRVKPISYVRADAADLIRGLQENGGPLVITQNGEATQETLALLKILALGRRQVEEGRTVRAEEVFRRLRRRRARG